MTVAPRKILLTYVYTDVESKQGHLQSRIPLHTSTGQLWWIGSFSAVIIAAMHRIVYSKCFYLVLKFLPTIVFLQEMAIDHSTYEWVNFESTLAGTRKAAVLVARFWPS